MNQSNLTIDQWLKEDDLTISDVAKKLNISRQHFNSIKNGEPSGRALGYKIWIISGCRINLIELLYPPKEVARITCSLNKIQQNA